jgi:hypothetical protein
VTQGEVEADQYDLEARTYTATFKCRGTFTKKIRIDRKIYPNSASFSVDGIEGVIEEGFLILSMTPHEDVIKLTIEPAPEKSV